MLSTRLAAAGPVSRRVRVLGFGQHVGLGVERVVVRLGVVAAAHQIISQSASHAAMQPAARHHHSRHIYPNPQDLVPEDDEEPTEGFTEVDGIIFEGDFEDDSVKPSLTSLLEDVGDDVGGDAFKLDSDDSFFSIPDYVPSELPDLAALGSGA